MLFRVNQPGTMHFGRVKIGELYSVSPMATLGPIVREFSQFGSLERAKTSRERIGSEQRLQEWDYERSLREIESRQFEGSRVDGSRVREFELDSSVLPTVKSEANKESENWVAESVIPNKYRHPGTIYSSWG
jgi:hypothetical protein